MPEKYAKSPDELLDERTVHFDYAGDSPTRLDVFLVEHLDHFSRSHVQKIIKNGTAFINGEKARASDKLRKGDAVAIEIPPPEPTDIQPEDIPLDIIFEDDCLVVINKQKNLTVHPTPNRTSGTLVNALLAHCDGNLSGINGILRPGIIHRLDKQTSGLIVVAKSDIAHVSIADQMRNRETRKRYTAIVSGIVRDINGEVRTHIGRCPFDRKKMAVVTSGGKSAHTEYDIVRRYNFFTHIDVILHTGRTHQIRVHMAHIDHPVIGDPLYGGCKFNAEGRKIAPAAAARIQSEIDLLDGQALHARELSFIHPMTGEPLHFTAPLPPDIDRFLTFIKNGGDNAV